MGPRTIAVAILLGGLIAGTIDIGAAVLMSGKDTVFILQFIAAGLIGKTASFKGGGGAAVLGLSLQWAMSLIIAAIYVLAGLRLGWLRRAWFAGGLVYGAVVFAVMNYVVRPLSAIGGVPHFTAQSFAENLAAMLLFGLIVAFFARAPGTVNPS